MASWHKIWENRAEKNHNGADFDNNWLTNEHRRFYEEEVYTHFIISFGFVILLQGIFLFLFLLVKIVYTMKTK